MKELVKYADVLTPNITEACILTDTPYKKSWQRKEIIEIAKKLSSVGPSKVVRTGINQKTYITNLCFVKEEEPVFISTHKIGTGRHGTGDIFTSMIAADAVNGVDFKESVRKAAHFISNYRLTSAKVYTHTKKSVDKADTVSPCLFTCLCN